MTLRPVRASDHANWLPLWQQYNAFYGRTGATALDDAVTAETWRRFLDPHSDVWAWVATWEGQLAALAHCVTHASTTRLPNVTYLQDLFTSEPLRGRGLARALIAAVVDEARARGSARVYWQTQAGNTAARALYDKVARHHGFVVYSLDV
jgi:GNAT superfamily N-acetyltransferase